MTSASEPGIPSGLTAARSVPSKLTHSKANIVLAGLLGGPIVGGLGTAILLVTLTILTAIQAGGSGAAVDLTAALFGLLIGAVGGVIAGPLISFCALLFGLISSKIAQRADVGVWIGAFVAGTLLSGVIIVNFATSTEVKIGASLALGLLAATALVLEWNYGWCIGALRLGRTQRAR